MKVSAVSACGRALALVSFASLLVAGCGSTDPTATPLPAIATPIALEPTPARLPPTANPVPPTATSIPTTAAPTALPGALTVNAPLGNPPRLDGTLSRGEWDGARREKLSAGGELLLMQNEGYLYLGIRADGHSVTSVFLDRGDAVAVLHSSGSLGTAVYELGESGWQQTRTFAWTLQDKSFSEAAQQQRQQFLETEGWLASLGSMGDPEETEFQVAMPQGTLRLAVAFPLAPTYDKAAVWPAGLADDVCNIGLLQGDALAQARFSPGQWGVVTVAGHKTAGPQPTATHTTGPGHFSRTQLIEDARQLAQVIEDAHPDPYLYGGGKIAFHRRLQRLFDAVPAEGMTREEFVRLLRPFIAAVGDAHTELRPGYSVSDHAPGGVPLRFGVVEQSLYVAGVLGPEHGDLIGSLLVSVEGVPLAELCERQRELQGADNEYHVLSLLATLSLWYKPRLEDLLPEWQEADRVRVELQLPGGEIRQVVFGLPVGTDAILAPESSAALPAAGDSGFLYEFLDAERKTAYLRVDRMSDYREAAEMETGQPAPGLPSATQTFRSMVVEMEQAGTETLIVDLRDSGGGHPVMADILTYFLYGKEALWSVSAHADSVGGGIVHKYSDLFWERTQGRTSLDQVNAGRALPLRADDYDFAGFFGDVEWSRTRQVEAIRLNERTWWSLSPTFWEEYLSRRYSGHYCPGNVVVLTGAETSGSGFTMAGHLYLAGATSVGTPPGQAANSFGNGQAWHLDHTGIEGTVSTAYSVMFPDGSEMAHVLPVHYPLAYEKLASYGFDRNAEYLYALELLSEHGESFGLPAKLDREIERVFRESESPGLAVGVVVDRELVYAKGFGVVNLETEGDVTPRTLFHMASITKPFVATSIAQLLEQGRLSLDDRIVEHLPYFALADSRDDTLTIGQFLTHSSGMPDVEDYHWDEPEYDEGALERYVRGLTDHVLLFSPGEQFSYSNMAFEVLGDLIAKVSGVPFEDYVREHILLPLGMNDSSILIRDVDPALLASGHVQEEGGGIRVSEHYAYHRAHGPSSCLHSNVVDMSRWAIANMNRGELESSRILHAPSYELLWTPAVEAGASDGRPRYVGLSWFLSDYGGYQMVSHGGRDIGYRANLVMVPDAGVAVVVLSNYSGPDDAVIEVTRLALELALGSE